MQTNFKGILKCVCTTQKLRVFTKHIKYSCLRKILCLAVFMLCFYLDLMLCFNLRFMLRFNLHFMLHLPCVLGCVLSCVLCCVLCCDLTCIVCGIYSAFKAAFYLAFYAVFWLAFMAAFTLRLRLHFTWHFMLHFDLRFMLHFTLCFILCFYLHLLLRFMHNTKNVYLCLFLKRSNLVDLAKAYIFFVLCKHTRLRWLLSSPFWPFSLGGRPRTLDFEITSWVFFHWTTVAKESFMLSIEKRSSLFQYQFEQKRVKGLKTFLRL